ncbi:MAG: twin-arginine translocase subunit TatC [Planctomycetota bacterium]
MTENSSEDPVEESRMSLGDHLDELRARLLKGLVAVLVMFAAAWSYKEEIYDVVATPMNQAVDWLNEHKVEQAEAKLAAEPDLPRERYFDADGELVQPVSRLALSTAPGGMFFVYLKSTAYFSLFLGGPVLLYQMWMFIAAGLYKSERRMVLSYLPASLALFFGGVIFAFSVMVPYAIYFLNKDGLLQLELQLRIDEYFSFLSTLCLGLGVVFQLPIVMNALVRIGLVESKDLGRFRGYFALLAFVLAAVITPPDPFTQMMMAVPMILLFEVGVITSRIGRRRPRPEREADGA